MGDLCLRKGEILTPLPKPLSQTTHNISPQTPCASSSSAAMDRYSEGDSETQPSKTPACSISASHLVMANMKFNPLMKLSKYSPGRFPPGEKEKEEGVDEGDSRQEVEEDCLRGGVETPDPILFANPSKPTPTEAAGKRPSGLFWG
jgi:hypothetical protein